MSIGLVRTDCVEGQVPRYDLRLVSRLNGAFGFLYPSHLTILLTGLCCALGGQTHHV